MTRFPEAELRIFRNVFVCRRCKSKLHSPGMKIVQGKVRCRKCGAGTLRPLRKK